MSKHYRCAVTVLGVAQLTLVACVGAKDTRNMTEPATGVRNVGTADQPDFDIFVTERTRRAGPD